MKIINISHLFLYTFNFNCLTLVGSPDSINFVRFFFVSISLWLLSSIIIFTLFCKISSVKYNFDVYLFKLKKFKSYTFLEIRFQYVQKHLVLKCVVYMKLYNFILLITLSKTVLLNLE